MMSAPTYEELSAEDRSFLIAEGENTHMNVGGPTIFETGDLSTPEGGIDSERIRAHVASRLQAIPRYRQRLAYTPVFNRPVWVDDTDFNLNYHIRHMSLPRPGTERQLKRLTAWILCQHLDRRKPLWELWIVEGVEGGRFALVCKVHHCMTDGVSGVELLSALLGFTAEETIPTPAAWTPRPTPSWGELLTDEVSRQVKAPLALARRLGRLWQEPDRAQAELQHSVGAVWDLITAGMHGAASTPLNRPIGPYRRFDWLSMDLAEVKQIKNALGGTINDVVLTTVAGALRRLFEQRRVNVDVLDYRAAVPVNVRAPEERTRMGNRVSAWLASLPLHERDPRRRFVAVHNMTADLKASRQARGAEALLELAEWAGPTLFGLGVQMVGLMQPYNIIVTNVAGPQVPLYLLGAQMVAGYPVVPLFENQGLGVALFSYNGQLCWGFNADWDLVPDLHDFVAGVARSFRELCAAARGVEVRAVEATRTAPVRKPRRRRQAAAQRHGRSIVASVGPTIGHANGDGGSPQSRRSEERSTRRE